MDAFVCMIILGGHQTWIVNTLLLAVVGLTGLAPTWSFTWKPGFSTFKFFSWEGIPLNTWAFNPPLRE